tara:strand:- start:70 stop:447 length:378 start_codon:yes stop_codon:yes gene_type:complete
MAIDNPDKIAAIEKAISKKYGAEAIQSPKANWDQEKEKEYIEQMKNLYTKVKLSEEQWEKVDINGIKVSKKLLNRESLRSCSICGNFPKKSMDDVCLIKFDCCSKCHLQYVEGREERWLKGWRPE